MLDSYSLFESDLAATLTYPFSLLQVIFNLARGVVKSYQLPVTRLSSQPYTVSLFALLIKLLLLLYTLLQLLKAFLSLFFLYRGIRRLR